MSGKNRKRNNLINFYVSDLEKEIIDSKIKKAGLKDRSVYLRKISTQGAIIKLDIEGLNNLIYEINKIGININQIAKKINETDSIYKTDINELQFKLNKIYDKISESF